MILNRHANLTAGICVLLCAYGLGLTACNQTLTVKVERIDIKPESVAGTFNEESAVGALMRTKCNAEVYLAQVRNQTAGTAPWADLDSITQLQTLIDNAEQSLKDVGFLDAAQKANTAAKTKATSFEASSPTRSSLLIKCRGLAQTIAGVLRAMTEQIAVRLGTTSASSNQSYRVIEFLSEEATKNASSGQTGFGGFALQGVHMLSPGDPKYQEVLIAEQSGSTRPISVATANISGDSTVIFVQENPTQMRVYSIDSDASRLSQNILLITDKALEAAVKYMVP